MGDLQQKQFFENKLQTAWEKEPYSLAKATKFEDRVRATAYEVAEIIIAKHKDYGPDNIEIFGQQGLVVRMWDKIGRLKHLLWGKKNPSCESVEDSFTDLAGYGIIGKMLVKGDWRSD